jgi:hypothetical protein
MMRNDPRFPKDGPSDDVKEEQDDHSDEKGIGSEMGGDLPFSTTPCQTVTWWRSKMKKRVKGRWG